MLAVNVQNALRTGITEVVTDPKCSGPGGLRSHDNWLRRHVLQQKQHPVLTRRRAPTPF